MALDLDAVDGQAVVVGREFTIEDQGRVAGYAVYTVDIGRQPADDDLLGHLTGVVDVVEAEVHEVGNTSSRHGTDVRPDTQFGIRRAQQAPGAQVRCIQAIVTVGDAGRGDLRFDLGKEGVRTIVFDPKRIAAIRPGRLHGSSDNGDVFTWVATRLQGDAKLIVGGTTGLQADQLGLGTDRLGIQDGRRADDLHAHISRHLAWRQGRARDGEADVAQQGRAGARREKESRRQAVQIHRVGVEGRDRAQVGDLEGQDVLVHIIGVAIYLQGRHQDAGVLYRFGWAIGHEGLLALGRHFRSADVLPPGELDGLGKFSRHIHPRVAEAQSAHRQPGWDTAGGMCDAKRLIGIRGCVLKSGGRIDLAGIENNSRRLQVELDLGDGRSEVVFQVDGIATKIALVGRDHDHQGIAGRAARG